MVWQEAALPMSCYIVRKTTTRSMPQGRVLAAWGAVILLHRLFLLYQGVTNVVICALIHVTTIAWRCLRRLGMLLLCLFRKKAMCAVG